MRPLDMIDNFKINESNTSELKYGNIISNADFTVCIPIYGRGVFLKDVLENLNSLNSYGLLIQIIISDNKEYDGINDALSEIKLYSNLNIAYYLSKKVLGQLGNFNRCIELCKTEYACMLHDDDLLTNQYFLYVKKILPFLQKKEVSIVQGNFIIFNDKIPKYKIKKNIKIHKLSKFTVSHHGITMTGIPSCGIIFNKKFFVKYGGFNLNYRSSGDAFLAGVQMINKCKIYKFECLTGFYRVAVNQSLKLDVCRNFIIEDFDFGEDWMKYGSIFRKLFMSSYRWYRYSKNIELKVSLFSNYNSDISIESLDYKGKYKKYRKYGIANITYHLFSKVELIINKLTTHKV